VSGLLAFGVEFSKAAAINTYGRTQENEADADAVLAMHRAGLRPQALAEFFEKLQEKEGDAADMIPTWLRSHDEHEKRVHAIRHAAGALRGFRHIPLAIDWDKVQERLGPTEKPEGPGLDPEGTSGDSPPPE
ncbi:MAG: M48 family metalloprotease, partial [Myxococcales bacterium]|nr:M48 family metalloprotease [Myxococcales bacterium]